MKKIRYLLFIVGMLTLLVPAQAQNTVELFLRDSENTQPIAGVHFLHGDDKGYSDEQGKIRFRYEPGLPLYLTHIQYGSWVLKESSLQLALERGEILREAQVYSYYPVTVLALRPKTEEKEVFELDYSDKMAHDGGALLNQSPAVASIRKGGNYGFDPVLRGFKYDQLNIVFNGAQSATAACPNRMDPPTSQMAPNMMQKIEVLKGPHALRYGNAFGGTINFVPAKPQFGNRKTYGRVSSGLDVNGTVSRSEALLGYRSEKMDVNVLGSFAQGFDYDAGNGNNVGGDFLRASLGLDLNMLLGQNQRLRLMANRNLARDADFPALPMDLRDDDTWMFNLRHDVDLSGPFLKSVNTTVFASFVDHLMDNLLKELSPRMMNASTNAKTRNYGARVESVWKFEGSHLFSGFDYRGEYAEGSRRREFLMGPMAGNVVFDNAWQEASIHRPAFFAEYHIERLDYRFIISSRLEANLANAIDVEPAFEAIYPSQNVSDLNPSFSVGGLRQFGQRFNLGLWLGRSQRSGGLTERYINFFPVGLDPFELLGNPNLLPEKNNQMDITLEYRTLDISLSLDLFAAYLQDYISSFIDPDLSPRLPNSPGVRSFTNIDEAFKTGFEISASTSLPFHLQQNLNLAYTWAQDLEREEPLPEIAPLDVRYALIGTYLQDRFQPKIQFRYVADQSRVSREFGEQESPSFFIVDVEGSFRLAGRLQLRAGVQNLLNEAYFEHLNRSVRDASAAPIFAPGRNVYLSLNVDFM